jgi:hypothetical protein
MRFSGSVKKPNMIFLRATAKGMSIPTRSLTTDAGKPVMDGAMTLVQQFARRHWSYTEGGRELDNA